MRILVSGATGMVGAHVVKKALGRGHDVTAVARHADGLAMDDPALKKVSLDILDRSAAIAAVLELPGDQE